MWHGAHEKMLSGGIMRNGFDALFGNAAEKQRLISSISDGTLPHALMIVGDEGSGKKTLALEIAMALNCEQKDDVGSPLPCRRCNTCRRIAEGKFTDVKRLKIPDGRATIGVDEVRSFKEDMYLSATEAKYKVYIFEDAESLTVQAQNALLIALEEPFSNVISILLTKSQDKILSTIKSRTRQIVMERFSFESLSEYFLEYSDAARAMNRTQHERFSGILMSAGGSIGAAKLMLEDDGGENEDKRNTVVKILTSLGTKGKYTELHRTISELPKTRSELKLVFEHIILAIRDLTVLKHDAGGVLIFFSDRGTALELSKRFNQKRLLAVYDITCSMIENLDKNANVVSLLTSLAAKIKNC